MTELSWVIEGDPIPKGRPRHGKGHSCFWCRVDTGNRDGCWEWQGPAMSAGYGAVSLGSREAGHELAHRMAYRLSQGAIPSGMYVCHSCDNRLCCRPSHLFLGTPQDNTDDMLRKGRARRVTGEDHPHAKLTDEQVADIRKRYRPPGTPGLRYGNAGQLADEHGIHLKYVRDVAKGKWRK